MRVYGVNILAKDRNLAYHICGIVSKDEFDLGGHKCSHKYFNGIQRIASFRKEVEWMLYIYIYIYIYRERERERESGKQWGILHMNVS